MKENETKKTVVRVTEGNPAATEEVLQKAKLAGKLPLKAMFIGVGLMVIIWSLNVLLKTFHLI